MEIIELAGYTEIEKIHIANKYLVPKQAKEHGLKMGEQIEFTDDGLREIIHSYTREAGVRNLEREIATLIRKQARRIAEGKTGEAGRHAEVVHEALGVPKFRAEREVEDRVKKPGVSVGLVWTPVGGDIVFIEASRMRGGKQFTMTGHLGEVMQESMTAALTWVRANAERYDIDPDFFRKQDIHIHVPSGAVPKDGPSAGVAMVTALVSLLSGRPVRPRVAMTGELSLTGVVLPVGGIKEKVLGAKRAGIREVILPAENEPNVNEDLQPHMLEGMEIHYVTQWIRRWSSRSPSPRRSRQASKRGSSRRWAGARSAADPLIEQSCMSHNKPGSLKGGRAFFAPAWEGQSPDWRVCRTPIRRLAFPGFKAHQSRLLLIFVDAPRTQTISGVRQRARK